MQPAFMRLAVLIFCETISKQKVKTEETPIINNFNNYIWSSNEIYWIKVLSFIHILILY
jgi:hypothetical protein